MVSYPFAFDVKVLLFVKVVTPMYNTLFVFLSMDPPLMYSSHFGHLLLEMILHMFTQFHVSQGSVIVTRKYTYFEALVTSLEAHLRYFCTHGHPLHMPHWRS
jgi:hypothetical protein